MYNDGFVNKNYTQHLYLTFTQSYTQKERLGLKVEAAGKSFSI